MFSFYFDVFYINARHFEFWACFLWGYISSLILSWNLQISVVNVILNACLHLERLICKLLLIYE